MTILSDNLLHMTLVHITEPPFLFGHVVGETSSTGEENA